MGIFNDPPLEPWERARGDAYQALEKAERIHAATLRLLQRIEQANLTHNERELDASGNVANDKTPAQEEIERDEWRRQEERRFGKAAAFGMAIKEVVESIGGKK